MLTQVVYHLMLFAKAILTISKQGLYRKYCVFQIPGLSPYKININ